MIPTSILGVALVAAALGPGYVFVRIGAEKKPRRTQSQVGEVVEMLVIGALASTVAAGVVLSIGTATGFIDETALATDFDGYLVTSPSHAFAALVGVFALAYGGAALVAWRWHRGDHDYEPDGSAWFQAFISRCPPGHVPFLTVELEEGRRIAGAYQGSTAEHGDNRELLLSEPLVEVPTAAARPKELIDRFVLLREDDIRAITGRYIRAWRTAGGESVDARRRGE